jgi:hypothetical protein
MGVVVSTIALLLFSAIRKARDQGVAEANDDATRRQIEALVAESRRGTEQLGRMADADAASIADTAASARERMRNRDPRTR